MGIVTKDSLNSKSLPCMIKTTHLSDEPNLKAEKLYG